MRYLITLALAILAASTAAHAAHPAHLRDVLYSDGLVTLVFTQPTNYRTALWKAENRLIIDVEASGVDLQLSGITVGAPCLAGIRWQQNSDDSVRVVLDLGAAKPPVVLTSPPANIIPIRIADPGSPEAQPNDAQPGAPAALAAPPPSDAPAPAAAPSAASAEIGPFEVVRGADGRPERIVVRTTAPVTPRASWLHNRLVIDLPEVGRTPERIEPANDPVMLRVRTSTYQGRGRVVVDFTRRVGYKLSGLEDGLGFMLDCLLPPPEAPAPPSEPESEMAIDAPVGDSLKGRLIVLDAGHGAHDTGARSQWGTEKALNLDMVLRLRRVLEAAGARVEVTRQDDTFIPLRERPALAMRLGADAFISIHCNSSARPTNTGTEVFHRREHAESKRLADALYRAHLAATGLRGRGVKADSSAPQGGLAVLKNTTVPNALVEVAFLNSPADGPKLADPLWRQKVAEALARGLARFMEGRG